MEEKEMMSIVEDLEKKGSVEKTKWNLLSEEDQDAIIDKIIERNIYQQKLMGFTFNPVTRTYQDEKTYNKWVEEQAGVQDANENARSERDDRKEFRG